MSFESAEHQRRLADYARTIVLDEARGADRWENTNPMASPALAAAVIAARTKYSADIERIQRADLARAQHVIDKWTLNGWGTAPQWARATVERLKHLDDESDTESALAALTAAIA
jgi:hypothetical protein